MIKTFLTFSLFALHLSAVVSVEMSTDLFDGPIPQNFRTPALGNKIITKFSDLRLTTPEDRLKLQDFFDLARTFCFFTAIDGEGRGIFHQRLDALFEAPTFTVEERETLRAIFDALFTGPSRERFGAEALRERVDNVPAKNTIRDLVITRPTHEMYLMPLLIRNLLGALFHGADRPTSFCSEILTGPLFCEWVSMQSVEMFQQAPRWSELNSQIKELQKKLEIMGSLGDFGDFAEKISSGQPLYDFVGAKLGAKSKSKKVKVNAGLREIHRQCGTAAEMDTQIRELNQAIGRMSYTLFKLVQDLLKKSNMAYLLDDAKISHDFLGIISSFRSLLAGSLLADGDPNLVTRVQAYRKLLEDLNSFLEGKETFFSEKSRLERSIFRDFLREEKLRTSDAYDYFTKFIAPSLIDLASESPCWPIYNTVSYLGLSETAARKESLKAAAAAARVAEADLLKELKEDERKKAQKKADAPKHKKAPAQAVAAPASAFSQTDAKSKMDCWVQTDEAVRTQDVSAGPDEAMRPRTATLDQSIGSDDPLTRDMATSTRLPKGIDQGVDNQDDLPGVHLSDKGTSPKAPETAKREPEARSASTTSADSDIETFRAHLKGQSRRISAQESDLKRQGTEIAALRLQLEAARNKEAFLTSSLSASAVIQSQQRSEIGFLRKLSAQRSDGDRQLLDRTRQVYAQNMDIFALRAELNRLFAENQTLLFVNAAFAQRNLELEQAPRASFVEAGPPDMQQHEAPAPDALAAGTPLPAAPTDLVGVAPSHSTGARSVSGENDTSAAAAPPADPPA